MIRLVLIVLRADETTPLPPFYGRAGWLLRVDRSEQFTFIRNFGGTAKWVSRTVIDSEAEGLICAHVDADALTHLTAAGIDIRLGPCSVPAIELVGRFAELPRAAVQ